MPTIINTIKYYTVEIWLSVYEQTSIFFDQMNKHLLIWYKQISPIIGTSFYSLISLIMWQRTLPKKMCQKTSIRDPPCTGSLASWNPLKAILMGCQEECQSVMWHDMTWHSCWLSFENVEMWKQNIQLLIPS